jgi:cysteine-rich repeat protein
MIRNFTAAAAVTALAMCGAISFGAGCSGDDSPTPACGDGILAGSEACDDGNDVGSDGCSASCRVELGWTCIEELGCNPICGDGEVVGDEACDDSNTRNGDGCSSACVIENATEIDCSDNVDNDVDGQIDCADDDCEGVEPCATNPEDCGNGVDDDSDALVDCADPDCRASILCDTSVERNCADGVDNDFDGATDCDDLDCECGGPACGDGTVDVDEQCDDGMANSDTESDACRSNCRIARCGDGTLDSNEDCDDGEENSVNGSCTPACRRPPVDCSANGAAIDLLASSVGVGTNRFRYEGVVNSGSGNNYDTNEICGSSGNDVMLFIQSPINFDVVIRVISELTTAPITLSFWDTCTADAVPNSCDPGVEGTLLTANLRAGTSYYLLVDTSAPAGGTFTLEFFVPEEIVAPGEVCDPAAALRPCQSGFVCRPFAGSNVCVESDVALLNRGDACNPTSTSELCGDGLECDRNVCRLRVGGSCETPVQNDEIGNLGSGDEVILEVVPSTFYRELPSSCASSDTWDVFELEADAAGVLTVDVALSEGAIGTPAVFLRSYCNIRASEVDCDWDEAEGTAHIETPVTAGDSFSLHVGGGSSLAMTTRLLPYRALDAECDETGVTDRCEAGLRCSSGGVCVRPEPGTCGAPLESEVVGSGRLDLRAVIVSPEVTNLGDQATSSCGAEGTWDQIYSVMIPGKGELTAEMVTSDRDVSISFRTSCLDADSEVECLVYEPDASGLLAKRIPVEEGLLYFVVDSGSASTASDLGALVLSFDPVGRFGDQCEFSEDCRQGLYCLFQPDQPFSTCVWLELFPGEACTLGLARCVDGFYCTGTEEEPEGTCEAISEGSGDGSGAGDGSGLP